MHPEGQHTGFYNDLDMMVIGMPGMSRSANRVHMSLWAISGAPLIIGPDLTKLTNSDLAILTNSEVLAVDQDALGLQCVKVAEPSAGLQVWAKPLIGTGRRAVVLLNRTSNPAPISVRWSELGLQPSQASVRNLWEHRDLGGYTGSYTATVPADDVVMVVIEGVSEQAHRYRNGFSVAESRAVANGNEVSFNGVASHGNFAFLRIAYTNRETIPMIETMQVNGEHPTNIAFAPTGDRLGSVIVEAQLQDHENTISFSSRCNRGVHVAFISVSSW